jgi:hypothetical protein
MMRVLRDPWWQAAGVLVSIIGLLVAIAGISKSGNDTPLEELGNVTSPAPTTTRSPSVPTASPSTTPTPAPTSATPNSPPGSVTCINGDGSNNTNNCGLLPPQSIGRISYDFGFALFAWFDGPVRDLPPPKAGQVRGSDCDEWGTWLTHTPRLHIVDPVIDFGMEGNFADNVSISKVEARIYQRRKVDATDGTLVKCLFGGGSNAFYNVSVNTERRETTVTEMDLGSPTDREPYLMPPASISLSRGGHVGVRITLDSPSNYMYEGSITVTASINGKAKVFHIGAPDQPFRWATPAKADDVDADYVAWDGNNKDWARNFYPYQ